ncbi:MAG: hypothetical protein ACLP52_20250 [Streptosporangiaceae bacterium]
MSASPAAMARQAARVALLPAWSLPLPAVRLSVIRKHRMGHLFLPPLWPGLVSEIERHAV